MKVIDPLVVKSIKIDDLFEIFNYEIDYPPKENVLILTGPNGFGKTQVLNILYNLFNRKFIFFHKLIFTKIIVCLNNDISIEITRSVLKQKREEGEEVEKINIDFIFTENGIKIETYQYTAKIDAVLMRNISRFLEVSKLQDDRWMDHQSGRILSIEELVSEYSDQLPPDISNRFYKIKTERANQILDSINVHLIREQRLFKKVESTEGKYNRNRNQTVMIDTIQSYSNELKTLISTKTQASFIISQELDSTYPNRLITEKQKVSKEVYDRKFKALKEKQEKLIKNGLYKNTQKALGYSPDDSKALLVYLNDLEKKLNVFDSLLEKLELFTSILNERRFTYKSINISREKGFYFKTTKDKELKLNQLSSGEQHEVVLLYELIFKTDRGILVLIDEPEISLHITWQKEFLDDLLKIINIQKFQVLVATHSPSIINDRWDLVHNLKKSNL